MGLLSPHKETELPLPPLEHLTYDSHLPAPMLFASGCSPSAGQTPVCSLSGLTLPNDNGSGPNWAIPKDEVGDGVGSLLLEAGW